MMTTPKRRAGGLRQAAAAIAVAIALAVAGLSASEGPVSPHQPPTATPVFLPLPGKAVGVVVSDAQAVLRREGRYGPEDVACFARGEASYRWFYVPARGGAGGEALVLGVGESGGKTRSFNNLVMATTQTLRPWSVTTPYALVEVVVNGGLGSPPEEGFAATDLKVLDGSSRYPIKVAEVIRDLRTRYRAEHDARKGLTEAMEEARKRALKDRKPTGPREQADTMYVTWLPDREVLRVEFRTEVRDGAYHYGRGVERAGADNPRSDVPPPEKSSPRDPGIRHGTSFGIVTGMVYEVSRDGTIGPGRPLPPRPFAQEIPPPGSAPRDPPPLPVPPAAPRGT